MLYGALLAKPQLYKGDMQMSINLQKGQRIDLSKNGGETLKEVLIGLGWDEVKKGGLFGSPTYNIDCDASVLLCGADGKLIGNHSRNPMVYYGNLTGAGGAVYHHGDNLTGAGEGDDEQITVKLSEIPSSIHKLVFIVNIYQAKDRKQHFGMIENAFIRVENSETHTEICKFNLTENYANKTALIVGEIYRHGGGWKFTAQGYGTTDGSIREIANRYR